MLGFCAYAAFQLQRKLVVGNSGVTPELMNSRKSVFSLFGLFSEPQMHNSGRTEYYYVFTTVYGHCSHLGLLTLGS